MQLGLELENKSQFANFFGKLWAVTLMNVGQFVDQEALPNTSVLLFNVAYCFIVYTLTA